MAHSLEGRSPFLDHDLVEFVARLPVRLKLDGRRTKVLLRRAFADLLPEATRRRGKRGFAAPVEAWLRRDLRPLVHDLLLAPDARVREFVRTAEVSRLVHQHETGRFNHGRRIWCLLVLETWCRAR